MQKLTAAWYRLRYYLASLLPLALGVRPSWPLLKLLLSSSAASPVLLELRRPRRCFWIRTRLDAWVVKEVCLDRQYERISGPVEDGWLVLDVGAGVGEFCIDAVLGKPATVVHAFEPSPAAYSLLCENILLNEVSENVRTHPWALGDQNDSVDFDSSGSSTVVHRVVTPEVAEHRSTIRVPCRTLNRVFRDLRLERCDLLKIDCEGGEYALLRAATRETLSRIRRICLEYHDSGTHHHETLVDWLTGAGFEVRRTPGPPFRDTGFILAIRD